MLLHLKLNLFMNFMPSLFRAACPTHIIGHYFICVTFDERHALESRKHKEALRTPSLCDVTASQLSRFQTFRRDMTPSPLRVLRQCVILGYREKIT